MGVEGKRMKVERSSEAQSGASHHPMSQDQTRSVITHINDCLENKKEVRKILKLQNNNG